MLCVEHLKLGLAVTAPFGLKSDHPEGWIGRYHTLKSELTTIDINPMLVYGLTESLAIGGGFRTVYTRAELTIAVDFGTILFGQTGGLGEVSKFYPHPTDMQSSSIHTPASGLAWEVPWRYAVNVNRTLCKDPCSWNRTACRKGYTYQVGCFGRYRKQSWMTWQALVGFGKKRTDSRTKANYLRPVFRTLLRLDV